eukprot:357776_1
MDALQHFLQYKPLFIASGYIRCIEKQYGLTLPNEITILLSQFFAVLEQIRFNIFNAQNCVVLNDGLICKTSEHPHLRRCHRLFTSDQGYDVGVVIWKLKLTHVCTNPHSHEGAIGIVGGIDKDIVLNKRPWINDISFSDLVYLSRHHQRIESLNPTAPSQPNQMYVGVKLGEGDSLAVLLKCDESYYQN